MSNKVFERLYKDSSPEAIPQALLKLREHHKLSKRDVAEQIGVNFNAYFMWERGMCIPSYKNSLLLDKLFNTNLFTQLRGQRKCKTCGCTIKHKNMKAIYCSRKCKWIEGNKQKRLSQSKFKHRVKIGELNAKEKNREITS